MGLIVKKNQPINLLMLILILLLAAYLRIYRLDVIPNGLIPDEAIRGYDAYSLLKTGADSFGTRFPLFLRSFEDYTPALYSYLSIPFIAIFDLSAFSTRLASAVIGVIVVALTYPATRRVFGQTAALIAAFLLAISPWHILPSRTGAEWILMSLGPLLSITLAYRGLKHPSNLIAAGIAAGVSLYGYAPIKAFFPILIAGFVALYGNELRKQKLIAVTTLLLFLVIAAPIYVFSFTSTGMHRFNIVFEGTQSTFQKTVTGLVNNYFAYFSPSFFMHGDYFDKLKPPLPIAHLKSVGLISWAELLAIFLGGSRVFKLRHRHGWFILYWLIVSPLGINLHSNSPWPTLWLTAIPVPHMLAGAGLSGLISLIREPQIHLFKPPWRPSTRLLKPFLTLLVIGLSLSIFNNFRVMHNDLFYEFPVYGAKAWYYGRGEAISVMESLKNQYDHTDLISDSLSTSVYLLFYTRYDPAKRHAELAATPQDIWQNIDGYNLGRVEDFLQRPGCHLILTTISNADAIRTQSPYLFPIRQLDLPTGEPNIGLFVYPSPSPQIVEHGAVFGTQIMLQGFGLVSEKPTTTFRPGQSVCLILQWQALDQINTDYTTFVRLVGTLNPNPNSPLWAQHDGPPLHGAKPTSTWNKGEITQDPHRFIIPPNIPPGQYQIEVGLYDSVTAQRVPVQAIGNNNDKTVLLEVTIQEE